MVTTTDFARIVSSIYSAVLAPDGWSAALDDIRQTFGATGSALVLADASNREILSARIPEAAGDSYRRYYRHLDYVLATVERNPVGMLLSGAGLVALGAGTEFDADWMRRYDMQDGLFVRLNAQPPITSFLVAGPKGNAVFATSDRVAFVNALVPHLQRALRIQDHVRELCGAALDASSAVDALGHGVMILGDRGEVLHVNPAAQSVLDRADGLTVRLSRLTADCARAAVEIRTAVANALGQERDSAPAASAVVCPRPHGRPYILHVKPQCSGEAGGRARATVIVIDPQRRAEPPASL